MLTVINNKLTQKQNVTDTYEHINMLIVCLCFVVKLHTDNNFHSFTEYCIVFFISKCFYLFSINYHFASAFVVVAFS